ncbi:MAG: hypothetical protein HZA82_03405 [Thaumarchaeota archaeon]|nr:hypothetical protein [Nitrososphaerota archaeon]
MAKLKQRGWTVIPTQGSKSPLDIIAYNKRKKLWWGIQVKSTNANMTFDNESLDSLCKDLHLKPVLAFVKAVKPRDAQFCMKKSGRFYHVFEDGSIIHPLGEDWDCIAFKAKISVKS